MRDRLAIPLNAHPARQKLWRAVGFLGLLLGAALLGYVLERGIEYRSAPERWPIAANLEIRVIKTPRTTRLLTAGWAGTQVLPGAPWDLNQILSWTKREVVVYAHDNEVVGLTVDGHIPPEVAANLNTWGWSTFAVGQRTLIAANHGPAPLAAERHFSPWLILPIFDGSLAFKNQDQDVHSLPFQLSSATSIALPFSAKAYIPQTQLGLSPDTELTGSFALPAEESAAFLPSSVPGAFPGLQTLSKQAKDANLDVILGQDDLGSAFVMAFPSSSSLSLDELGAIASEGANLQDLSTAALTTEGLSTSTEIRSQGHTDVKVSNEGGLAVAVAETEDGQIFRVTQSPTQLIVSNRNPVIGPNIAKYSGTCLKHPAGFLKPQALSSSVPGFASNFGQAILDRFPRANEVAYRKNWLKICW